MTQLEGEHPMRRILMLSLVLAVLGAMIISTAAFACNGEPGNGPGEPGYSYGPGDGECDCPSGDCDCDGDGPIQDRDRDGRQ
jgi:hypothetical protein